MNRVTLYILILLLFGCKTNMPKIEPLWYIDSKGEKEITILRYIKTPYSSKEEIKELTEIKGPDAGYNAIKIKYENSGCFHQKQIEIEINYKTNPPTLSLKIPDEKPILRPLTLNDAQNFNSHLNWFRVIKNNFYSTNENSITVTWLKDSKILHNESYINKMGEYAIEFGTSLDEYIDKTYELTNLGVEYNEIYMPEKLFDGKPNIKGNFWEIANSPNINLNQKAFIEAFTLGSSLKQNMAYLTPNNIEELGITDLSPLQGLSQVLKEINGEIGQVFELKFISTRLKNISAIAEFTSLHRLTISGSEVEDFSPISKLINLQYLDISHSQTKNLSPIKVLVNLEELVLDKENMLSLEEIQHLIKPHLNNQNETISLKVYFSEKVKSITPHKLGGNNVNNIITPTLIGSYKYKWMTLMKENEITGPFYEDSSGVDLVIFENQYSLNIKFFIDGIAQNISQKGSYTAKGNLITFKPENGKEYICSFYWSPSLHFDIIDRVNFPKFTSIKYTFEKISNIPEK